MGVAVGDKYLQTNVERKKKKRNGRQTEHYSYFYGYWLLIGKEKKHKGPKLSLVGLSGQFNSQPLWTGKEKGY